MITSRVEALLREAPVVDGHNDLPWAHRVRVRNDYAGLDVGRDTTSEGLHTDIPRLRSGGVGAEAADLEATREEGAVGPEPRPAGAMPAADAGGMRSPEPGTGAVEALQAAVMTQTPAPAHSPGEPTILDAHRVADWSDRPGQRDRDWRGQSHAGHVDRLP